MVGGRNSGNSHMVGGRNRGESLMAGGRNSGDSRIVRVQIAGNRAWWEAGIGRNHSHMVGGTDRV